MQLSSLSLIYLALSAFVAAAFLVVHMNYAEAPNEAWSTPLSIGQYVPPEASPSATVLLVSDRSMIEM